METSFGLGVGLAVGSGLLQGGILVPMKFARNWKWENVWLIFATCAYLLLPWFLAALTVPSLGRVYAGARIGSTVLVALFGLGWGVSVVLFGLACEELGMALGFAVILGLGTAAGALVPLLWQHPEKLLQPEGLKVAAAVLIMIAGVSICSWAGKLRDEAMQRGAPAETDRPKQSFAFGLLLALLSGLLNPLINFALVSGSDITKEAVALGASKQFAPNVLWALIGTAAFVPNAAYCVYLLRGNRSLTLFWQVRANVRNFLLAFLMGLMWIGGIVMYGSSTVYLGEIGPSVGWPIFIACLIISSNLWGVLFSEWSASGRKPLTVMYCGVAAFVASVVVIAI